MDARQTAHSVGIFISGFRSRSQGDESLWPPGQVTNLSQVGPQQIRVCDSPWTEH